MTLTSCADETVPVTVQARTVVAPSRAFEIIAPIDLSLIFKGWGPVPAVRGVKNQTGEWDHVGASRNPDLSDESTATETLSEYTAPHSFAYELVDFTNILGKLAYGVRGEWTFTPDHDGAVIRWTYELKPRPHRRSFVRIALAPLWRRYTQASIEAAVRAAEREDMPSQPERTCIALPSRFTARQTGLWRRSFTAARGRGSASRR